MTEKQKKTENLYLVFNQGGNRVFNFFLKKDFSHVFILKQIGKKWIVIDPCQSGLKVNQYEDVDLVNFYYLKKFLILKVIPLKKTIDEKFLPRMMPFLTCVTLAKYAVGMKGLSFTPYQLYNNLLDNPNFFTYEVKHVW